MNHIADGRLRPGLSAAACALLLAACQAQPDLAAVRAQAERPLQRYHAVQTLNANQRVVIAGTQAGALLVSSDAGQSWRRTAAAGASLIDSAQCPDGSFIALDFYRRVWPVGADGEALAPAAFDEPQVPLSIACDPKGGWWVAGTHAGIAHSADRGRTWTHLDLGEDAQITALQFVDEAYAIAVGEFGLVAASTDGGASWTRLEPIPNDFYPYAALFLSREEGWVSGIAGQILHTADGGRSWERQANDAQAPLYRLFLHEGVPHGVGAGGVVARLEGGAWRPVPYPDPLPVAFGAGASLPGQSALAAGSPGGLVRVIGTRAN
ncbi:WD40/YVTN/BNR-like repeat-containing protein [Thauera linaloolentis]|uniref:Glycosyl hydrolase n=1 Tax=Thauera linaloolentis (strain DSM 12138 / JCM 21573 / CCUG 41526 / CIP 105981 / IAM 15112 / NBRC 102519 / 47Lol) TaxID=1123367 RepID=N6YYH0_THAL4|nr:YCF48-related protein [Thauera linaloolentis]ENO84969.1 glycosyl hydrolase [Thauera linaloolentis 47Lol = DSM 12138]MCM8566962.1 YCF48-related protein [Thauera linaloolentis]